MHVQNDIEGEELQMEKDLMQLKPKKITLGCQY